IKIVPVFAEMFQSFGTELPALTQYIVNFSGLLRRFAFPLIVLSPVSLINSPFCSMLSHA
ncbi:MAG: type II secretion system F family protein, partial [Spirochaetota bacterium]